MKNMQEAKITAHLLADDGSIPNNETCALLLYAGSIGLGESSAGSRDPAAVCEEIFTTNGWGRTWRNGIFDYHHYHSNTHEALAIACGRVTVHLGGEQGIVAELTAGDVVVIPAGCGHKNLGQSDDLLVVGAYPPGPAWDLCRGLADERPLVLETIRAVPLPHADPIYGVDGPLLGYWVDG